MEPTNSLTQFYDDLKKGKPEMGLSRPANVHMIGAPNSPGTMAWRNKALHHCDALKNKCCKHILLDIYCKILPFDKDYIDHHHGQMCGDIDNFLAHKGMTATQYLTSCYEATKAPLLEFILRSTDNIGKGYMKEADDILKDSQGEEIQEPREPETTDDDVEGQLVDVKEDPEYENFIDKLKQKTIQKIVDDVSALIDKSKEENDMTFDTKPDQDAVAQESAVGIGMDYLQKKLWKNNIEFTEEQREEMIGMAIREATLRQLDVVFKQPGNTFREFVSTIFYNKGVIINESAVEVFDESKKSKPDIIDVINSLEKLKSLKPATDAQIADAEKQLGLKFAKEYKKYLSKFGHISAVGVELSGIANAKYINVVDVTKSEWDLNPKVPKNMYVIENPAIDGIIIWQDSKGIIYQSTPNREPKKFASSLAEYLQK